MPPAADTMSTTGRYEEYTKKEISFIETELKDWFLQRRFAAERNMAIKKTLDENNFTGLAMNNSEVPPAEQVLWRDLVTGKPEVEESLSSSAKEMKVDMYTKIFKDATDLDHPCRIPGSAYLRCLKDNLRENAGPRATSCMNSFGIFDACRRSLLQKQETAVTNTMIKQDIADRRAKALFERRSILLDTIGAR